MRAGILPVTSSHLLTVSSGYTLVQPDLCCRICTHPLSAASFCQRVACLLAHGHPGLGPYIHESDNTMSQRVSSLNNADRERSSITLLLLSEIKPH